MAASGFLVGKDEKVAWVGPQATFFIGATPAHEQLPVFAAQHPKRPD